MSIRAKSSALNVTAHEVLIDHGVPVADGISGSFCAIGKVSQPADVAAVGSRRTTRSQVRKAIRTQVSHVS